MIRCCLQGIVKLFLCVQTGKSFFFLCSALFFYFNFFGLLLSIVTLWFSELQRENERAIMSDADNPDRELNFPEFLEALVCIFLFIYLYWGSFLIWKSLIRLSTLLLNFHLFMCMIDFSLFIFIFLLPSFLLFFFLLFFWLFSQVSYSSNSFCESCSTYNLTIANHTYYSEAHYSKSKNKCRASFSFSIRWAIVSGTRNRKKNFL